MNWPRQYFGYITVNHVFFIAKGGRYGFEKNRCFGDTWGQFDVVC